MNRIAVACPTCGHSGAIQEAAAPTGPVRIRCPRCQETFIFTKEARGALTEPSGSAPPAPAPGKAPPSRPGEARSASAPDRRIVRSARGRRKLLAATGAVACGAVIVAAAWMHVFKLTPIVAEKLLIGALFSRVPPVQDVAIVALREYPTKHAAVALVLFINLKNLHEVPDPKKPEPPEERARRRQQRVRDLGLAERAAETLCLLTGHGFGTYFKLEPSGHSWGSLSEDRWPTVLRQIDAWALQTFGAGELPVLHLIVPEAPSQPAAAPATGGAR